MHQEPMDQVADIVEPVMTGFRRCRVTRGEHKTAFAVDFIEVDENAFPFPRKVTIFALDAYPSQDRGEAKINVWNSIGSDSKAMCDRFVYALRQKGLEARTTKHKKCWVVALKYDWRIA